MVVRREVVLILSVGGSLSSDELYLLEVKDILESVQWTIIPVVGQTPGRRYGHILSFFDPFLIIFGGNTGIDPSNDAWFLNVGKGPFAWTKILSTSELLSPRVYHSGAQCMAGSATGMMITFGGRNAEQVSLNDSWGLRRHRDGSWDWLKAPYKTGTNIPEGRYQHSAIFANTLMVIIGGRSNNAMQTMSTYIYNTESGIWTKSNSIKRFRHASWSIGDMIYVYGGFQQDSLNVPTDTILGFDVGKIMKEIIVISKEEKAAPSTSIRPVTTAVLTSKIEPSSSGAPRINSAVVSKQTKPVVTEEKDFRLASKAQVATSVNTEDPKMNDRILKIPLTHLHEEAKKLNGNMLKVDNERKNPNESLYSMFISQLLHPKKFSKENTRNAFMFRKNYIIELAKEFQILLEAQPMVVKMRTPVKIFGNLFGNFQDLMRIFELWKSPIDDGLGGDIDSLAYLFLGNYVDRGNRGLETICLLMALKLKYPESITLLRGSHEDRLVNILYGFGEECSTRLHENINSPNSVFHTINNAFSWLPFAAIIDNKIFCVHSGIGPNLKRIEDLNKITLPIELGSESTDVEKAILLNCLWSDPADTDVEFGFKRNHFRHAISTDHIYKYGADIVKQFLEINKMDFIIRSHEIALTGMDVFANSKLVTINSCTNYCGMCNNSGCILVIKKTLEI